jgi:hypothetical protein
MIWIKRWRLAAPGPVPAPMTLPERVDPRMTTPLHSAEEAATPPGAGEDGRPVTERHGDGRHCPGNATSRRRNVSGSKRICARTETTHSGEHVGAGKRATVAAMLGSPAPTAATVTVSAHAAERYRHRVQPGLGLHAARGELERPRAMGEISAREPAWLHAASPTPDDLLIGGAIALPQAGGWVATTCVARRMLTPTRRDRQSTHKPLRAARRRAQRRTRA